MKHLNFKTFFPRADGFGGLQAQINRNIHAETVFFCLWGHCERSFFSVLDGKKVGLHEKTKTGNATYASLSVNWFPELVGVVNRDDTVLEESAKKFKDALSEPEQYTKFYVYYFARDCSGLYPWCQEIPRTLVPRGDTIKILQRNYINPGSRRGPDPHKVLNPVSIQFDGGKGKRPTM